MLKVVVGDGAVGKTSLICRYCEGKFDTARVQTVGVEFQTQTVDLPQGTVKLCIWDVAGQDRFEVMRAGFYRGSRASALVYDVTLQETFENLSRWREEILKAVQQQPFSHQQSVSNIVGQVSIPGRFICNPAGRVWKPALCALLVCCKVEAISGQLSAFSHQPSITSLHSLFPDPRSL